VDEELAACDGTAWRGDRCASSSGSPPGRAPRWRDAAMRGRAAGQSSAANARRRGGAEPSPSEAVRFSPGRRPGERPGRRRPGRVYDDGRGVPRDPAQAAARFRRPPTKPATRGQSRLAETDPSRRRTRHPRTWRRRQVAAVGPVPQAPRRRAAQFWESACPRAGRAARCSSGGAWCNWPPNMGHPAFAVMQGPLVRARRGNGSRPRARPTHG